MDGHGKPKSAADRSTYQVHMTPDDSRNGPGPISAEIYPAPVLEYDLTDGEPVVDSVDVTFRSEFGVVAGDALVESLRAAGLRPSVPASDFEDRVLDGDTFEVRFEVETGGGLKQRCATVVAGPDSSGGHIVFACTCNHSHNGGDGIGADHVASVVSHDLRNPLEVAKTRLRAARETGQAEHFDRVAGAHDRMERIIDDVLTLAGGEDTVEPSAEVDLTEIARDAWDAVDSDEANLTIDSRLPTAVVDPDRTSRVFENLFRNSVEHGTPGGRQGSGDNANRDSADGRTGSDRGGDRGPNPETNRSAEETETRLNVRIGTVDSDASAGFYVADDGAGIAPEERNAVLEPGYTTDQHGTGLGLAIVDQIADAHGWTVAVTSSEADGARIEVTGV